jgi:hypothetical protein
VLGRAHRPPPTDPSHRQTAPLLDGPSASMIASQQKWTPARGLASTCTNWRVMPERAWTPSTRLDAPYDHYPGPVDRPLPPSDSTAARQSECQHLARGLACMCTNWQAMPESRLDVFDAPIDHLLSDRSHRHVQPELDSQCASMFVSQQRWTRAQGLAGMYTNCHYGTWAKP